METHAKNQVFRASSLLPIVLVSLPVAVVKMPWEWQLWGEKIYSGSSSGAQASWWGFGVVGTWSSCSHLVHTRFTSWMYTAVHVSFSVCIVHGCSPGSVPRTMGRPSHLGHHNQGNPSQACQPISQVMPDLSSPHFRGALLPFFHLRVSSNSRETPAYLSMSTTRNGSKGLGWAHALYKDFPRCLHCGRLNFSVFIIHLHGS